jgi:hypothetical protein
VAVLACSPRPARGEPGSDPRPPTPRQGCSLSLAWVTTASPSPAWCGSASTSTAPAPGSTRRSSGQKGRNLLSNPKVSLLVVDPDNTARYIQLRGDAELVSDGALEHLDALIPSYDGHPAYYGYVYPVAQRWRETRVVCRIHAQRVTWTRSTPEPGRALTRTSPAAGAVRQGPPVDGYCQLVTMGCDSPHPCAVHGSV